MAPRLLDVRDMASIRPRRAVLVVEDAISVRSMLSEFFIGHGYEVLHARHPDVALKRLNASGASIDAVILDVHLDDNRSGLEVLELIRLDERFVDLTVGILTAYSPFDDEAVELIQRTGRTLQAIGMRAVFERLKASSRRARVRLSVPFSVPSRSFPSTPQQRLQGPRSDGVFSA